MIIVESSNVPSEVIEMIGILNCKGYLETNYCDYYPNEVNFVEDKVVRYKQLKSGYYAIVKTFYKS